MKKDNQQYRDRIEKLGMTQIGAARFLGIGDRTSRRFASDDSVPRAIQMLFAIMIKYNIKPEDVFALLGLKLPRDGFGDRRYLEDE